MKGKRAGIEPRFRVLQDGHYGGYNIIINNKKTYGTSK